MEEGFTQEIEVNQEMVEIAEKFRERFEKFANKKFNNYVPKTFSTKDSDGKIFYNLKIQLDEADEIGEIEFEIIIEGTQRKFRVHKIIRNGGTSLDEF